MKTSKALIPNIWQKERIVSVELSLLKGKMYCKPREEWERRETSCCVLRHLAWLKTGLVWLEKAIPNWTTHCKISELSLLSLCFGYANCKGNKQKVKTTQQAIVLSPAPYLKSGLFKENKSLTRCGLHQLSAAFVFLSQQCARCTGTAALRICLGNRLWSGRGQARLSHLSPSPASSSAWREAEAR